MRIGIVTTYYRTVGGISTYVKNVVAHSRADGVKPLVFSPDSKAIDESDGHIYVNSRSRVVVIPQLISQLRRYDIRYIQCHGTWYLLLACVIYKHLRKLAGVKIRVVTVKHSDLTKPSWLKRIVLQGIDNASDGIVFVSRYLQEKYLHNFGYRFAKPLNIVNPGCGIVTINQDVQAQLAILLHTPVRRSLLTYIGLFEYPGKVRGLILLLEAVALLKLRIPDLLLAIAGRGRLKGEVTAAIDRLGLHTTVQIIEDLDSPYELLQLSDLHCHISLQDNFPLVVLEALNCGTPVVASAVGELPHIDISGLVIASADAKSIAVALECSLDQPPNVDVKSVRERFDWTGSASALNCFTMGTHD